MAALQKTRICNDPLQRAAVLLPSLQTPAAALFTLIICRTGGQQALRQKLPVLCGKEDVCSKQSSESG